MPWYEVARGNRTAAGWRDCGSLEQVLHREWARTAEPPAEAVNAINRLADLPRLIKDRLAAGLDAIHVGGGGVPDLDDMGRLKGVPLPSGRATWDACAGAYGDRKIVVGSRPSPTPDVMCHEVGHALDDIDGEPGHWQSDSDDFCALYENCQPHLVEQPAPATRDSRPQRVLRRRIRGHRIQAAARSGRYARRRHQVRAERDALFQHALRHLMEWAGERCT